MRTTPLTRPVVALDDVDVVQLEAGSAFTIALDAAGLVHVWGRNDQGQLGLGGGLAMDVYALEDMPRPIDLPDGSLLEATKIAAGHSHAAIITPDGRLLQWGAKNALEPAEHVFQTDDDDDNDTRVAPASVYCGGAYTIAIATDGRLFSFGQGSSKCLGHGDKKRRPHPTHIDALQGFALDTISCGYRHVAMLGSWDESGQVAK